MNIVVNYENNPLPEDFGARAGEKLVPVLDPDSQTGPSFGACEFQSK